MSDTQITIQHIDNNIIFTSNKEIEGEYVSYDLNSIKEIFKLNPIAPIHFVIDKNTEELNFNIKYDNSKESFFIDMVNKSEILSSEPITTIEMLQLLMDSYLNNTYITYNTILTSKTFKMLNKTITDMLQDCKVPRTDFVLEGRGEVRCEGQTIALFERMLLSPKACKVILCECVGKVRFGAKVSINLESSIGISVLIPEMFVYSDSEHGEVMDIQYLTAKVNTFKDLIEEIELNKTDEFDFATKLQVIPSHDLLTGSAASVIKSCVQRLNETDTDLLLNFVRDKKDIIFANEEENDLVSQVNDLFDDLF